jgi:hypothetical protein
MLINMNNLRKFLEVEASAHLDTRENKEDRER